MSKGWDNATLKKLKALTGKGLSTSEIGKRLGMSKNAVVGKLNRMGWNSKAGGVVTTDTKKSSKASEEKKGLVKKVAEKLQKKTVASKKETKKTLAGKKAETKKTVAKAENKKSPAKDTKTLNKSLAMHQRIIQHSLEMANLKPNQCRWPIGDPDSENFHFCGEQVFVGKPYCYEHCKQAYQFTPPKKK